MSHLHAHFEFLSVHSPLIQNDLYHIEDVFRYFLEGLRNLRISDENDIQFDSGSRMPCIDKHHHSHSGKKWLCGILKRYKMWWIAKWSKKIYHQFCWLHFREWAVGGRIQCHRLPSRRGDEASRDRSSGCRDRLYSRRPSKEYRVRELKIEITSQSG